MPSIARIGGYPPTPKVNYVPPVRHEDADAKRGAAAAQIAAGSEHPAVKAAAAPEPHKVQAPVHTQATAPVHSDRPAVKVTLSPEAQKILAEQKPHR